jgi:hypothetical protein
MKGGGERRLRTAEMKFMRSTAGYSLLKGKGKRKFVPVLN